MLYLFDLVFVARPPVLHDRHVSDLHILRPTKRWARAAVVASPRGLHLEQLAQHHVVHPVRDLL
jgi:hypothetical protein